MINTVKQILKKLINNIGEYKVGYYYYIIGTELEVFYTYNNLPGKLTIHDDRVVIYINNVGPVTISIPEDDIYEIKDLCQKLKRAGEAYVITKCKEFADSSSSEDNSDLD